MPFLHCRATMTAAFVESPEPPNREEPSSRMKTAGGMRIAPQGRLRVAANRGRPGDGCRAGLGVRDGSRRRKEWLKLAGHCGDLLTVAELAAREEAGTLFLMLSPSMPRAGHELA